METIFGDSLAAFLALIFALIAAYLLYLLWRLRGSLDTILTDLRSNTPLLLHIEEHVEKLRILPPGTPRKAAPMARSAAAPATGAGETGEDTSDSEGSGETTEEILEEIAEQRRIIIEIQAKVCGKMKEQGDTCQPPPLKPEGKPKNGQENTANVGGS